MSEFRFLIYVLLFQVVSFSAVLVGMDGPERYFGAMLLFLSGMGASWLVESRNGDAP